MTPRMTPDEITLLKSFYSQAKNYFEWGCGGSTVIADSYDNIEKIYSVESDQKWIDSVQQCLKNNKTNFYYVDVNAGEWGAPKDSSKKANWSSYSDRLTQTNSMFDLILVDGRFRVACAAMAYDYLTSAGYLLVHDYSSSRAYYHVIEEIYTMVDRVNKLAVFKKIEKLESLAASLYNEYKLKQE